MKLKTHLSSALAAAPFVAFTDGGVHFLLMGAAFPDTDLIFKDKGHRTSVLHTIEIPLIVFLLLYYFVPMYGYPAWCFFAGWTVHLLGDLVQGGVRSFLFGRKIGLKSFYWDKYYNTPKGILIDVLLMFAGFWGIYTVVFSKKIYFSLASIAASFYFGSAQNVFLVLLAMAGAIYWLSVAL